MSDTIAGMPPSIATMHHDGMKKIISAYGAFMHNFVPSCFSPYTRNNSASLHQSTSCYGRYQGTSWWSVLQSRLCTFRKSNPHGQGRWHEDGTCSQNVITPNH